MKQIIFLAIFLSTVFASTYHDELQKGVYYYKHHNYERALEVFDRLLINHPNSKRVRLEYARVLYAMGRYDEATKEFKKVLAQNPPPIVQKNIKWFLKKIDKKRKKNFYRASLSVGITNDNNIENKSNNPVYAGFIDSHPDKRKDRFITTEMSLSHIRKLKKGAWKNNFYFYDESSHDKESDTISFLSYSTAYQFIARGVRVTLPIGYSMVSLAKQRYVNSYSFKPSFDKKLTSKLMTNITLSYQKDKNLIDNEKDVKVLGIKNSYFFSYKLLRNMLGLEYKNFKRVNGNRLDVSKTRKSFIISSSMPLFETNMLSMFFKRSIDRYKEKDPTIDDNREDKNNNLNLSFKQNITKHQSFEIGFSKIKNKSNLDFYSYDKDTVSLKFIYDLL